MRNKIRVLLAKLGLDGHNRGAMVIASAFRDAGMEVIYTGLRQTPESVVRVAIQEDVDVVGISMLSGSHMTYVPEVVKLLKEAGAGNKLVIAGGCIGREDADELRRLGVAEVFGTGTPTTKAIEFLDDKFKASGKTRAQTISLPFQKGKQP